ncbi:MAG TPA: FAD-dependent oxidoreductase, partial [Xanthobacteraceae bacterium]|nr:FAD-dependent oxidoreductase [Xanthobacteraceae bacterium]
IVIEKADFGKEAASGLNAGQFLTGWAKPVDVMLAELAQQELRSGQSAAAAGLRAERRVRAFLRRTVEGCHRLAELDHAYNLRASVQRGALMAAISEADMEKIKTGYAFMERSNFRTLMPLVMRRRPPFFDVLSAHDISKQYGTAEGLYAGGIVDHFGGSFRPRKFLIGLMRALQKRGVRFFSQTEAQSIDIVDNHIAVFCENGATVRADMLFMANAYARHINGDMRERAIYEYDYVVQLEMPEDAQVLMSGNVMSDTREPCFYARRHGQFLYMGYEETAETSPELTRAVAQRTLKEAKRIFPALREANESDIKSAWSGRVFYTLDDYPFVERRYGGRVIAFAAPSDHGNAIAMRVGQIVGYFAACTTLRKADGDYPQRRTIEQQLRLFEEFPKGSRLRPGRRYQEAAWREEED